uniref:NADH-ubiquinone oxidoreductase chain 5 n=1 Tax=Laternula truncata TaxID=1199070 RepID=A0A1U9XPM1_9BIVA|nr:NADH dehydrogenase subunit 5 [Laternula truncata]AQZ26183.1 NADH dehydrogenase subunit 5 [Laternula truncata]
MQKFNEAIVCGISLLIINVVIMFSSSVTGSLVVEWEVFSIASAFYSFPLLFDWVSMSFSWVVTYIASMVMFFSVGYMSEERFLGRFVWIVFFFVLSMNFLIFVPSVWGVMLGWDGLGVSSFALVIYYQNKKSLSAGLLTALVNRVGDAMMILSICMLCRQGQWSLCYHEEGFLACGMSMVIAAMTKSAQFPFCSWLPAAMAAPTPVSALVHSSTLVTAGVYILIRFSEYLNEVRGGLMFVASCTLMLAAIGANMENDLKKIIALSTLSQLGMMMLAISFNESSLALFHLLSHALLKALLFMCAGAMIHGGGDTQDIRLMGGLWASMPGTMACFNAANLALCGMPFVGAFYSKDLILEKILGGDAGLYMVILVVVSTGLTIAYSVRLSFMVGWGPSNAVPVSCYGDEKWQTGAMYGLVGAAVAGGSFLQKMFIEFNVVVFTFPCVKKVVPICLVLALSISLYLSLKSPSLKVKSHFFSSMWFLSNISGQPMVFNGLSPSFKFSSKMDKGWMEKGSGRGAYLNLSFAGVKHHFWQSLKVTGMVGGGLLFGGFSVLAL